MRHWALLWSWVTSMPISWKLAGGVATGIPGQVQADKCFLWLPGYTCPSYAYCNCSGDVCTRLIMNVDATSMLSSVNTRDIHG